MNGKIIVLVVIAFFLISALSYDKIAQAEIKQFHLSQATSLE